MVATRVEFETSTSLVLQHTATTDFDGTEVGRAVLANGAGNSQLTFRARSLGAYANAAAGHYRVAVAAPRGNPATYVRFDPNDNTLTVFARTSAAGAVLATAAEVAAAVAADVRMPLACAAGGTGAGLVAAFGPGDLAGGVDPVVLRNIQFKFPAQAHAGLFFFDQAGNVLVRQVEASLGASLAWVVSVVNLDEGLSPVAGEDVVLAAGTGTAVALTNLNFVLSPLRAVKLAAVGAGVARVVVHREPNFPSV